MLSDLIKKYKLDNISANYISSQRSAIRLYRNKVVEIIFSGENIDSFDDFLPFVDTLKEITFYKCNLSDLSELKRFEQLRDLTLECCSFSHMDVFNNFPDFPALKTLEITKNKKITNLNISSNSIKILNILDTSITNLANVDIPSLKELRTTNNYIKFIDKSFPKLENLYVDFKNFDFYSLKNTPNVRKLHGYNADTNQKLGGLENCRKLKHLDLYDSPFTNFLPFKKLKSLEFLDVQENKIESLMGLEHLPHLKKLYMFYNPIKEISDITPIKNLQVIAIEKHKILKIIDDLNFLGIKYITLGEG